MVQSREQRLPGSKYSLKRNIMNIVHVGGSFAGITAVLTAREKYKECTITL